MWKPNKAFLFLPEAETSDYRAFAGTEKRYPNAQNEII